MTLQNGVAGYAGARDTYLNVWYANSSLGTSELLRDRPGQYQTLVRFDVFTDEGGVVPAGSQIQSATLSVYKSSAYNYVYELHRVLRDWQESEATWNQARIGVPWTQVGAAGLGSDIAATADATGSAAWAAGWVDFDVTAAVQAIADGADNYGWKLVGVSGNGNTKQFHSSDYTGDPALRPKLIIQYSAAP